MGCRTLLNILFCLALPAVVAALPFNDDMVDSQLRTGTVVRERVPGTVPLGSLKYNLESKEVAAALDNPVSPVPKSLRRGKRLFDVHCASCHGLPVKEGHKAGPAGAFMGAPNLADAYYATKTEGQIFSVIRFGSFVMPALGWKLSHDETWDIVNYVKDAQGAK